MRVVETDSCGRTVTKMNDPLYRAIITKTNGDTITEIGSIDDCILDCEEAREQGDVESILITRYEGDRVNA